MINVSDIQVKNANAFVQKFWTIYVYIVYIYFVLYFDIKK